MRRTKEEAEKTKEAIFQAGIRLLASKGIQQTSMSDIAHVAGVTRGAIYWHFANKEDLFNEIHDRLSIFYETILAITEDDKPLEWSLKDALKTVLRRFSEDEEFRILQSLQIQIGMLYPGNTALERQKQDKEERIRSVFEKRCAQERICPDTDTETLLLVLHSFVMGTFAVQIGLGKRLGEEQIEKFISFFMRGLNGAA